MRNWTDKAIKQHVEDIIEESYLQSLQESEILEYLRGFVYSCETVLNDTVSIHGDVRLTKVKLTLLKAYLLLQENATSAFIRKSGSEQTTSRVDYLALQVVQLKSTIMSLLDTMNPAVAQAVFVENQARRTSGIKLQTKQKHHKTILVVTGYAVLLSFSLAVLAVSLLF